VLRESEGWCGGGDGVMVATVCLSERGLQELSNDGTLCDFCVHEKARDYVQKKVLQF